jgi:hypothetical protein
MREKFELCTKVFGLILFCLGSLAVVYAVLLLLHRPFLHSSDFLGDSPHGKQLQDQMAVVMSRANARIAVHILLSGVVPVGLGIYLMRSNNAFVRRCYPQREVALRPESISAPPPADASLSESAGGEQGTKTRPDARYAPPGYFP